MSELHVTLSNERQVSSIEAAVGVFKVNGEVSRHNGRLLSMSLSYITADGSSYLGDLSVNMGDGSINLNIFATGGACADDLYQAYRSILDNIETPA